MSLVQYYTVWSIKIQYEYEKLRLCVCVYIYMKNSEKKMYDVV